MNFNICSSYFEIMTFNIRQLMLDITFLTRILNEDLFKGQRTSRLELHLASQIWSLTDESLGITFEASFCMNTAVRIFRKRE